MTSECSVSEYNKFCKQAVAYITGNPGKVIAIVETFDYVGYDPKVIFGEMLKKGGDKLTKDVILMVQLFFYKGSNLTKMRAQSSPEGAKVIQKLIAKYGLQSKVTEPTSITLPRVMKTFPILAYYVSESMKNIHHPVTENEVDMPNTIAFSYGFIPSLLSSQRLKKEGGMILLIHNIYQTFLAYKTQPITIRKKSLSSFFPESVKYSMLAVNNTFVINKEAEIVMDKIVAKYASTVKAKTVVQGLKSIFKDEKIPKFEYVESPPHKALLEICGKSILDLDFEAFKQDMM